MSEHGFVVRLRHRHFNWLEEELQRTKQQLRETEEAYTKVVDYARTLQNKLADSVETCPNCGSGIDDEYNCCPYCGKELE